MRQQHQRDRVDHERKRQTRSEIVRDRRLPRLTSWGVLLHVSDLANA